ncbi:MAG TPA: beta-ribofuranosylaminobenzene 5'-phosphate synthase family protein, partial [Stellaceae bacterium]
AALFHQAFQSIVNAMPRNNFAAPHAATRREGRAAAVEVFAPARLHLGFLDLDGGLGRRFGGLGLAIDGFGTRLTLARAGAPAASGPGATRALGYLERAASALGLPPGARITLTEASPAHAGLGSGTQLGLAVVTALARLHRASIATPQLAQAIGRGARSGVGIGVFDLGGLIVDGGLGTDPEPAPVISRLDVPAEWRVLLILDHARHGLHGSAEMTAFGALPDFTEALAGRLCRLVLLRLLPGIAERDFVAVSAAVGEIQQRLGDYFSAAQNGRYTSPAVAEALAWLHATGIVGIGQSSWGPTGFALIDSAAHAAALATALRDRFAAIRNLEFRVVAGRNHGADITVLADEKEGEP